MYYQVLNAFYLVLQLRDGILVLWRRELGEVGGPFGIDLVALDATGVGAVDQAGTDRREDGCQDFD